MGYKKFFREALLTFALVYSIIISLFFIPYITFVNKTININYILAYLFAFIIYLVFWLVDKKDFIKNEINC